MWKYQSTESGSLTCIRQCVNCICQSPSVQFAKTIAKNCLHRICLAGFISLVFTSLITTVYAQSNEDKTDFTHSDVARSTAFDSQLWRLSQEELETVEELTERYRGLLSSELSPIEWLGIFATDDAKRRHYAQLLAKQQIRITNAILLFESHYAEAIKQTASKQSHNAITQPKLLLITSYACTDVSCKRNLLHALERVEQGEKLEILIQDELTDQDLEKWTMQNNIPPTRLRTGTVTVRQAEGRFLKLKEGVYRVR